MASGSISAPFNADDAMYKCCCQNCRSTTGIKVLVIVNIICLVVEVLSVVRGEAESSLFALLLTVGVTICLYMAQRSEKPGWLIPQLIICVLGIIVFACAAVILLILAFVGNEIFEEILNEQPEYRDFTSGGITTVGIVLALMCISMALLYLWIFAFVMAAYNFYRDQDSARMIGPLPLHQQPYLHVAGAPPAPPHFGQPYPQK